MHNSSVLQDYKWVYIAVTVIVHYAKDCSWNQLALKKLINEESCE